TAIGVADAAAERVQVVEWPEVEKVNIVAAVHARAGPSIEPAAAGVADLDVGVAQRKRRAEFAGVMKRITREGRRDHHGKITEAAEVVVVAEPELYIRLLCEDRLVGDGVQRWGFAPALVGEGADPAVGEKLEAVAARRRRWHEQRRGQNRARRCVALRR